MMPRPSDKYTPVPDAAVEPMIAEAQSLQDEIRTLNRQTTSTMLITLSVVSLATTLARGNEKDLAFLLAPLLLGAVSAYQFNVSAETSGMAEQRDRLFAVLNDHFNYPVYLQRKLSDLRRASLGTLGAYVTAGTVVVGSLVVGLIQNWNSGAQWRSAQIAVTLIALVAATLAMLDHFRIRVEINVALDEVGLGWARPSTAPRPGASIWERMRGRKPDVGAK